ncbi:MAG: serine/threonine-protein kinase [Rubrivivax sp.]
MPATPRPRRKLPPPAPLPIGTRLGRYELRSVLGIGAFSIVYRVVEPESELEYAVREYLPGSLAERRPDGSVAPRSAADAATFEHGQRFFLNEAKLLLQIDHPNLVKVHELWQERGTAYLAMDLYTGRNLQDTMSTRWRPPREPGLRNILAALLGPVAALHKGGLQHRDISPLTIMVEPDGRLVLMDLGAARRVTSALGETGPTGPRDGFAPIELYGSNGKPEGQAQAAAKGPWTDFYALGATLFYMVAGKPPPPAPERDGSRVALTLYRNDKRYSLELLALLDWMLAVPPAARPQSVAELRRALEGERGEGLPAPLKPTRALRWRLRLRRFKPLLWLLAIVLLAGGAVLTVRWGLKLPLVKDWLLRWS